MTDPTRPQLVPGSGPPKVDAAWVEQRVKAILAVEPYVGRPTVIAWIDLPRHLVGEHVEDVDRRLPMLSIQWPANDAGWSDEWTFAIPEGGDVGEYLEAVRDPLGL